MTQSTEQELAILYKGFCEWCKTVPHLDLDPRLHTHGGRIEDGGYIADTATAKAFAAWKAARRAQVVPQGWRMVPDEPTLSMQQAALKHVNKQYQTRDVYAAMLAAAPQPPEAAPVQLPDCRGRVMIDEDGECEIAWRGGMPPDNGTNIYTEHQVRELLVHK